MNTLNKKNKRTVLLLSVFGLALLGGGIYWTAGRISDRPQSWMAYRYQPQSSQSDPDRELRFYEARVSTRESALELNDLASAYREKGKRTGEAQWLDRAKRTAERSLQLLPHFNTGAKRILAGLAEDRHDFPAALLLAEEILREKPSDTEALAVIVTANLGLGQVKPATEAAQDLARKIPGLGSYSLRALVRLEAGRDVEALADFKKALLSEDFGDPEGSAWVRSLLGRYYLRTGQLRTARFLLEEALRIRPDYPLPMGLLAELEVKQDRLAAAEQLYRRAFELSREPSYRVDLGAALAAAGRREEAESLWKAAEAQMRDDLKANPYGHRGELVHLLLNRGRSEDIPEAVQLAEAEAKSRKNRETLETLAWAHSVSGRP